MSSQRLVERDGLTIGARIRPRPLPEGGTIAVVSPASAVLDSAAVLGATEWLERLGYRVCFGERFNGDWGHGAGLPGERARDLEQAFADPDVDAIVCLGGGDSAAHLLREIDYAVIRGNPKPFVGFSDITVLHSTLAAETRLVTFWGPMFAQLGRADGETRRGLIRALTSTDPLGIVDRDAPPARTIVPGVAEGELVGGTTSLLSSLLGTRWAPETEGKILLLEDVEEEPSRIHRFLTHLLHAGKLDRCAGICLAEFVRCEPRAGVPSLALEDIFDHVLVPLGIPVIHGVRLGHGSRLATVPFGVRARLDAVAGRLEILEPALAAA